ncbi:MAG: lipid-A-disaccharide synthase [Methylocystis sp.]|nr:lipid-A-disaccharide synthase [Methylocystis sp.]
MARRQTHIFLVAGEASGDQLGAALMRALRAADPEISFSGVGGEAMAREGLVSLFPLSDIAVMGLLPVLARLPRLYRRIEQTARTIVESAPDCLVIIDAPDFTHRLARRVRRASPSVPIIDYVSPSVWAWRPGRARAMRAYVDHVLALLPFEPQAHARLGGPPCTYVGHPLVEYLDLLTPNAEEAHARETKSPLLLILPGSRTAEVAHLMPVFGKTLELVSRQGVALDAALPVVAHVESAISKELRSWPAKPRLISQDQKFAAFRRARAALVASGAATLELALAGVPMAVAYKVNPVEALLRFLVKVDSIVLPNLVLGEKAIPEFLQEAATPQALADALAPLVVGGAAREAQQRAFVRVRERILAAGPRPSARAAAIVMEAARNNLARRTNMCDR